MSASGASPSSRGTGSGTGSGSDTGSSTGGRDRDHSVGSQHLATRSRRETAETKAAFKTTEFIAYVAILAGLLIAGLIVDDEGAGGFGAQEVWKYVTWLTIGYMISRGLAKAGSYAEDEAGSGNNR